MHLVLNVTGDHCDKVSRLLAKNPSNSYEREEKTGKVRILFTKNEQIEVEVLFLLQVDNLDLTNNQTTFSSITHYINDRESAVSSIFCTGLRKAVGTALNGKPKEEYKEWVDYAFPLELAFGPLATSLKDQEINALFEPLGYEVFIEYGEVALPASFEKKSSARYITLKGKQTIQHVFQHLFVLIPVLDQYKHYYMDDKEVEKLKRYGADWLDAHPMREYIIKQSLIFSELIKKMGGNGKHNTTQLEMPKEKKQTLNHLRYEKIVSTIAALPNKGEIIDFGAGEGKLTSKLGFIKGVQAIYAVEPSVNEQKKLIKRMELLKRTEHFLDPIVKWGSLYYYDSELANKDVFILCEVIEHIDEERLPYIMETIFRRYQPSHLIITTPNKDYNAVYDMKESKRHRDHRFEWTQEQFRIWCDHWEKNTVYQVKMEGIGEYKENFGYPTQMAVFTKGGASIEND